MKSTIAMASALLAVIALTQPALAQGGGQNAGGQNPLFAAPDIGTRITFYASSSITSTSAGQGYTQVDIVYRDADVCVGSIGSYAMDISSGAITSAAGSGFVTRGGSCADYWAPPAMLSQTQPSEAAELTVTRGAMELGGSTFQVVGFRNTASGGTYQSSYDLASGYLLVASSTVGTLLTYTDLRDVRPSGAPAVGTQLPAHVQGMSEMRYDCVTGTEFGGQMLELPCEQRVQVVARGQQWLQLRFVMRTQNTLVGTSDVTESDAVLAMNQVAGVFMAPDLLRSLRPQQLLTQNPVTGERVVVAQVDQRFAVLVVENQAESARLVYDVASGWLVEVQQERRSGMARQFLRMGLAGVQ